MNSEKKRILVVKLSSLGDIFHALPTVHNLKVALDAEIDWVTQPEYVGLVHCFPCVSSVIPFPRRQFWRRSWELWRTIRAQRYDYVIDLQGLIKSAIVTRFARGGITIGPSFQREGARFLYDDVAGTRNKNRHAVEENLDVIRYLGLPVIPVSFPVMFPAPTGDYPEPRVALVPLSRRANKNWPVSHFLETARQLQIERGASIFLFGSKEDRVVCERMREVLSATPGAGAVLNLAGQTSLVEMGGWFSKMNMVVANDSGPLHMAVALGIPVVALFGPTDPGRTGPYGVGQGVITSEMDCCPCFDKQCRLPRVDCMTGISPDQVMAVIRTLLNTAKIGQPS
ncbi:MAG: glycosyltransferase family 9 protein [bacterium]